MRWGEENKREREWEREQIQWKKTTATATATTRTTNDGKNRVYNRIKFENIKEVIIIGNAFKKRILSADVRLEFGRKEQRYTHIVRFWVEIFASRTVELLSLCRFFCVLSTTDATKTSTE